MEQAYKLAAAGVRQRFAEQHPDYLQILDSLEQNDVGVYSGTYDQAEEVLKYLDISAVVNPDPKNLSAKIIFINCSSSYDLELVPAIGKYVTDGNWLVSSDWALDRVIQNAFPNTVKWTGGSSGDEVVSVEPNLNSLWSDIVVLGADPQWWLWGSHPIEVIDSSKVYIEAASHDLLVNYNAPVVAVRFNWGKGHVFHVISHFWAKRSQTPTSRHQGSSSDFLKAGMKLSDEGIEKVFAQTKIAPDSVNFAQLQSAATSTELVAQLCVRAKSAKS